MNIQSRPFIIGMAAALVILIVVTIVNQGASLIFLPDLSAIDPNDPLAGGAMVATVVSCLTLICSISAYMIGGGVYGFMATKAEPVMELQDGVIGGAVIGGLAGIINAIIGAIIGVIVTTFFLSDQLAELSNLSPELGPIVGIAGIAGGIGGAVFSACCWLLVGGFLGAIGGAIGNSVAGRG